MIGALDIHLQIERDSESPKGFHDIDPYNFDFD